MFPRENEIKEIRKYEISERGKKKKSHEIFKKNPFLKRSHFPNYFFKYSLRGTHNLL